MAVSARRCHWRWRRVRAHIIAAILCLDAILLCNGQKPINLGGVKRRDVYIAGFFPYGRHVPESHVGRGVMPSVKLAVDHINENPTILRNYRLHMWWNDTEMQQIRGRRDNTVRYVYEGYEYHIDTTSVHLYRCSTRQSTHCRGAAEVIGVPPNQRVEVYTPHEGHLPNPTIVQEAAMKEDMIRLAIDTNDTPKAIFDLVCARNPVEVAQKLRFPAMKSAMDRARKKIRPLIPASLRDLAGVLDTYEPTAEIYRGLVEANDSVALLFISNEMLETLATASEIFIDGTFKVAPYQPPIAQLYTVHVRIMDTGLAAVFVLCSARTLSLYRAIFRKILELAPGIRATLRFVMGDYERAAMSAVRDAFPESSLHGCWFHFNQCNAAVGVKAFFDMMHSGPHKVMLFGAACTQVTDPIAKASKHWRLTQLSYADTHPMFTPESFPNFFRVVPSENAFNAPRVALLQHFNWTRVGTIYQNEPRYALAHNRLVADLDANKMEVVETQSFATEVSSALDKLKEKDVRIILGNFDEVWARRIFCEAHKFGMFGRKYQWVIMGTYAEEWWLRPGGGCAPSELAEALHAAILTDLLPLSTEQQITVSGITPDEYRVEYDSRRGPEYSRFHGYTYDGIWAVALAIQHVARMIRHHRRNQTVADFKYRDETWEKLFLEALKNTSFEGVTGPVRFYGNERKAYILLKQFQSGSEVKVGEYNGVTGELDLTRGQPLEWRGKSPPKDRTLHIIEHSMVNITIYAVLAAAASVGIVMAVIFLAINIRYRNQRYIKMSSPHLNNLIIIGCMLTYSSVIFLGLDSQLSSITAFPYICTARAWLLMAGFSLAFGSMFSKTWRVHSIFTDVKLGKKVIKDYQLFIVVGVLLFIDLAIMTTWQIADPFYRETKQMEPYPHPSSEDIIIIPENEYCQSNRMTVYLGSIYAYKGLLLIFGAFLAWETRHVSIPALNDSKYVGMSVYNVVIMCVTGAAISFVLADKQDAMFIILAVFIIFCSTATLCLVFVPKLIELRRNPQGSIDKKFRPTLRPASKTRRDSSATELEERLNEAKTTNQKFRKQLLEKESELQMFVRRLGNSCVNDTQEAMDRLVVPRPELIIRKEGPSGATETTDISMSMCSLNSTTVSQAEGEYVNLPTGDTSSTRKKTSFSKLPTIAIDSERIPLVPSTTTTTILHSAMKQPSDSTLRRKSRSTECRENEPLLEKSSEMKTAAEPSVDFVPELVEDSDPVVLEETDILRNGKLARVKERPEEAQPKLPTPPPGKNVSFGEPQEQNYLEQAILPPPLQFIPKHRQTGSVAVPPHQTSLRRRASVKNNGIGHHELFEKRRTSVPVNSISYISTENIRGAEDRTIEETLGGSFNKAYVIGECGHRRPIGGTGYRCERHGGRGHSHVNLNGGALDTPTPRRNRKLHDTHNASSPNVPTTVNASSSDTEKYEESLSTIIQRSVSEKSREKCVRARMGPGPVPLGECPHRASRRLRECRHAESKLRQQARMDYVQSTPNVATIHNNKFASGNRGSSVNVSKMYNAVSEGELLDTAILPIFQKLLSERHKNTTRGGYGASCPNISIKCDIVEYL